jgi:hypothetical protein
MWSFSYSLVRDIEATNDFLTKSSFQISVFFP